MIRVRGVIGGAMVRPEGIVKCVRDGVAEILEGSGECSIRGGEGLRYSHRRSGEGGLDVFDEGEDIVHLLIE